MTAVQAGKGRRAGVSFSFLIIGGQVKMFYAYGLCFELRD